LSSNATVKLRPTPAIRAGLKPPTIEKRAAPPVMAPPLSESRARSEPYPRLWTRVSSVPKPPAG